MAIAVGVVLVSILALTAVVDMAARFFQRDAVNVAATRSGGDAARDNQLKVSVGPFSWLVKQRVLWAPIFGAQTFEYRLSSKTASSVRNYVFHDVRSGQSQQLLPDNRSLIARTEVLTLGHTDGRTEPLLVVLALVDTDTNGDNRLSASDTAVIAVVDTDGSQFTRLPLSGRLLSAQTVDQRTGLLVMETASADVEGVVLDLETFKVVRRNPVWRASR